VTALPLHGSIEEEILEAAVVDELDSLGEDFLAHLVDQFRRETEFLLAELRDAHQIGDRPAVGRIAHSIKGSSSQIGGRRLASSCEELEQNATLEHGSTHDDDLRHVEKSYDELRLALTRRCRL
jgi:histidine phosphotransfer protein HptB